jgi:hypothetical protein
MTALFCSCQCPGNAILRALDLAAQLREANPAVISGFHKIYPAIYILQDQRALPL